MTLSGGNPQITAQRFPQESILTKYLQKNDFFNILLTAFNLSGHMTTRQFIVRLEKSKNISNALTY